MADTGVFGCKSIGTWVSWFVITVPSMNITRGAYSFLGNHSHDVHARPVYDFFPSPVVRNILGNPCDVRNRSNRWSFHVSFATQVFEKNL